MVSELRTLTKPVKVIGAVLVIMLSLLTFLAGNFFDRFYATDTNLQIAVADLKEKKVDKITFEKQCDLTRIELDKKANLEKVDVVQKRLDQIIGIMLDPSKKESVRAEIQHEKNRR
jgi:hypothetical protein